MRFQWPEQSTEKYKIGEYEINIDPQTSGNYKITTTKDANGNITLDKSKKYKLLKERSDRILNSLNATVEKIPLEKIKNVNFEDTIKAIKQIMDLLQQELVIQ